MSLGIALKGTEGIVIAADSRVTLFGQLPSSDPNTKLVVPATFDNATKILKTEKQKFVAAVTFGAGAIGLTEPRTASSFMPEFEEEIDHTTRMTVKEFAEKLGQFFLGQWKSAGMAAAPPVNENMVFVVAGYDLNKPYGEIYGLHVPLDPVPRQLIPDGQFGAYWGGQREMTDRLLSGFDPGIPDIVQDVLGIDQSKRDSDLGRKLQARLGIAIPWQFLPLQDCVDLCIFLVRTTIVLQKWLVGVRGVGGAVDVVTITRNRRTQRSSGKTSNWREAIIERMKFMPEIINSVANSATTKDWLNASKGMTLTSHCFSLLESQLHLTQQPHVSTIPTPNKGEIYPQNVGSIPNS